MKKRIGLILCILLLFLCACALADVPLDETTFPDLNFRNEVGRFDTDHDLILSDDELAGAESIILSSGYVYTSYSGIEYLYNLKTFRGTNQYDSLIPSVDFSRNTKLETIICDNSGIEKLTLGNLPNLKYLNCNLNKFTSLDLSGLPVLESLDCHENDLGSLDLSANPCLKELHCSFCKLEELDLSHTPLLTYLNCEFNELHAIDLSCLKDLETLNCSSNPSLQSIDLSALTKLTELICCGDKLESMDVSNNPNLKTLWCYTNQFTRLDVSACASLVKLIEENECIDKVFCLAFDADEFVLNSEELYYDRDVTVIAGDIKVTPGGKKESADNQVPVSSISLNETTATLTRTSKKARPTLQLVATVSPIDADNPSVEWTSSNPKVATVNGNGLVTALKKGTVTITCTARDDSGVKATCEIIVEDKLLSKLILNKSSAKIKKGKTLQLKVKTFKPADAFNKKVKWTTSNKKVATVDKNGKVKAKDKGTCYIICTAQDGGKVKVKCKITVK